MTFKIEISQFRGWSKIKQRKWNTIKHLCVGHIQIWHHVVYQKILKYLNDLQNRNFLILWLKWTQTRETKQNQTFFHGAYSNLTPYLYKKLLKYFSDFQNRNFSVLWLRWTQTMELKQNQTFFWGTYSNIHLLFLDKFYLKNEW